MFTRLVPALGALSLPRFRPVFLSTRGPKVRCSVKGCRSKETLCVSSEHCLFICGTHLASAPDRLKGRLDRALYRSGQVQAMWKDDELFDRAVAAGKYLSLCSLYKTAHDAVERA